MQVGFGFQVIFGTDKSFHLLRYISGLWALEFTFKFYELHLAIAVAIRVEREKIDAFYTDL